MSSVHQAAVEERLAALATDHETADDVYEYVTSDAPTPQPDAFLTTIRLDPALALEVRDSMGRDIIGALTDTQGVVRYPVWSHSAVAAKSGVGDVQTRHLERYRGAANYLDDHEPRVVLRDATELSELDAPSRWQAIDGPGDLWGGP